MTAEAHRQLRERIGALVLGALDDEEAALMRAHLDGCEECRREAAALSPLRELLLHADPAHLASTPRPPAGLAGRVLARIRAERRLRRRRRLRLALAGAGAALALGAGIVAGAALLGSSGSDAPEPEQVWVRAGGEELDLSAELVARSWGTQIHVYARGVRPGAWCRVFVRDRGGRRLAAGSFRYTRDTRSEPPTLSTGLALDRIRALELEAGRRSLVAPLRRPGAGGGGASWPHAQRPDG